MRAIVVAAMVAGCWTGSVPAETPPQTPIVAASDKALAPALRVRLERTQCARNCPVYTLEIDARRHIATFDGVAAVPMKGAKVARISNDEITQIETAIERARFFERDDRGHLPAEPTCTSDGTTTTCSLSASIALCPNSPTVILTVQRGKVSNRIEHEVCPFDDELGPLIDAIELIPRTRQWIYR